MNYYEPTDEQQKGWEEFLESRPEECDLPERDELVGAALDRSEVEQNIDAIRAIMLSRAK